MPTPAQTTPDKHRLRLLERRLAPSAPKPAQLFASPSHPSSAAPHVPVSSNTCSPIVSDKPESVQSFASDDDHAPVKHPNPTPAPPPVQPAIRKQRRKAAASGSNTGGTASNSASKAGGKAGPTTVSKKGKSTPPPKRRLGRVDEFFKPVSANGGNAAAGNGTGNGSSNARSAHRMRPPSPKPESSCDSRPPAGTTVTPSTTNINNSTATSAATAATPKPDDSYRFMRDMLDKLRRDNGQLRETVDELRTENEDLHAQVDLELPQLRETVSQREDDVVRHERRAANLSKVAEQLRSALCRAVVDGERARRKVAEHVSHSDGERLGKIVVSRGGVSNPVLEAWHDGREWKKVSAELSDVHAEMKAVDKRLRRRVRRRARNHTSHSTMLDSYDEQRSTGDAAGTATDSGDSSDSCEDAGAAPTLDVCDEDEEQLRVRAQTLEWRQESLNAQLKQMERERDCLIRELRRQNDERGSAFGNCPTLHSRYVLLNLLGRGGFSEVFRALDLDDGAIVACKIHQLSPSWSEDKKANFVRHAQREYQIHKELAHENVVRLLNIFEIDDNAFGTVLQYVDGVDLDMYLKARKTLAEREARCIIHQVFRGLDYLAQPGRRIIHYDLKPANILLYNGRALITDFGLSKVMADGTATRDGMELTSQGAGTMWYLPPECFEVASEARINSKVDVWSAGVILFQMLYGRKPFGHEQSQERIFREKTVQREDLVFPDTPNVSDPAKDFIKVCLTRNAKNRPDVRQVLTHPFLKRNAVK